jgi:molybdenum cofactor guanylyltransferase
VIQLSAVDYIALHTEVKVASVELRLSDTCERTKYLVMNEAFEQTELISVAILAGGQSRRMGRDKALLRVGSSTLLELVAERVKPLGAELFVVGSAREAYEELGVRVVADLRPGSGSLGGVYTALKTARYERCLVVGCDMPFLSRRLLHYMCGLPFDYDVLVPVLGGERSNQGLERTFETLHAIYARTALPAIERRIDRGAFKIADLIGDVLAREIDEATVRSFDPELRSFFNANTPDDFAFVERILEHDQNDT